MIDAEFVLDVLQYSFSDPAGMHASPCGIKSCGEVGRPQQQKGEGIMVQQAVREILEKKGEAEAKLFQNLYAYQERLMHAVRHGEENIDFEGMDPIGNPYFLALSRPGLRNRKNQCIVYITLAAENAIAGVI